MNIKNQEETKMSSKDNFGDRMKGYEKAFKPFLPRRMPIIIRIDGKAFHTYTRGLIKPFDENLAMAMSQTAKFLCENIAGCKLAYYQSDEISLLVTNDDKLTTEAWFDNNLQKIVSISASMATAYFNSLEWEGKPSKLAMFDSRVFILPVDEVNNYFLWRQNDATKNSISMLAQANYSQKQLQNLNGNDMQDKLMKEKGINWNDLSTWKKRGLCVKRQNIIKEKGVRNPYIIDLEIPVFSQDLDYVERYVRKKRTTE